MTAGLLEAGGRVGRIGGFSWSTIVSGGYISIAAPCPSCNYCFFEP